MSNLKNQLQGKISSKPSDWKAKARERLNSPWLNEYSAKIALRILAAIDNHPNLTQAELARQLNVSPQQIHKIIKGHENLTLETIYKLSKALEVELINFPEYAYSMPISGEYSQRINIKVEGTTREEISENIKRRAGIKWEMESTETGKYSTTLNKVA